MAKITNEQGGTQSFVAADFDCIPPEVLKLLAECLGRGARVYGRENWKKIPFSDNINHCMNHINEWRRGDRSEPHLVNAMARLTFALWQAVDSKQQDTTYIHPDDQPELSPHVMLEPKVTRETLCTEDDRITFFPPGKTPEECMRVPITEEIHMLDIKLKEHYTNFTRETTAYIHSFDQKLAQFEEKLSKLQDDLGEQLDALKYHNHRLRNLEEGGPGISARVSKLEQDHKELDKACAEDHRRIENIETRLLSPQEKVEPKVTPEYVAGLMGSMTYDELITVTQLMDRKNVFRKSE